VYTHTKIFFFQKPKVKANLVGVKTGRMKKKKRKIWWKIKFSLVWFRRENKRKRKWCRKFSLQAHKIFGRKTKEKR